MFVAKWPRPEGGTAFPPVLFLNFSLFGCLDEDVTHRTRGLDHGSVMSWHVAHVDPSSNSCNRCACVLGLRKTTLWHVFQHLVRDRWHAGRGGRYRFEEVGYAASIGQASWSVRDRNQKLTFRNQVCKSVHLHGERGDKNVNFVSLIFDR